MNSLSNLRKSLSGSTLTVALLERVKDYWNRNRVNHSKFAQSSNFLSKHDFIVAVIFLMIGMVIIFVIHHKSILTPVTPWFSADTFQYADEAIDRLMERPGDNGRHPLISMIHWAPLQLFIALGISIPNSLTLYVSIVAGLWIATGYLVLRGHGVARTIAILLSFFAIFSGSFIFSAPLFETLALGALSINVSLLLVNYSSQKDCRHRELVATCSVVIPFSVTTPLVAVPVIALMALMGLGRTIKAIVYALASMSLLFAFQSYIFPPTPFYFNRTWYVNLYDVSYWLESAPRWASYIFLLPLMETSSHESIDDQFSIDYSYSWPRSGITIIICLSVLVAIRRLLIEDKITILAPFIFLGILNVLFGREPHWQAPLALFPTLIILGVFLTSASGSPRTLPAISISALLILIAIMNLVLLGQTLELLDKTDANLLWGTLFSNVEIMEMLSEQ